MYMFILSTFTKNCRYRPNVVASDSTGGIEIILGDREVRSLISMRARQLINKVLPIAQTKPAIT